MINHKYVENDVNLYLTANKYYIFVITYSNL